MSYVVGVLAVLGAALAFIGALGLVRLPTFFERVHPPTLGTTLATALVLGASILHFSIAESRLVLRELVLAAVVLVTTPAAYMILVRAALRRHGGGADEEA